MSASDMITFVRWAKYNANPNINPRGDQPSYTSDMDYFTGNPGWANIEKGWVNGVWDPSKVTDYDWGGLVTKTGITHEHTLSGSGGTENVQGSFSFGYLSNDGTQKGQEYQRYNFASTVDVTPKSWFKDGALRSTFLTPSSSTVSHARVRSARTPVRPISTAQPKRFRVMRCRMMRTVISSTCLQVRSQPPSR